MNYLENYKFWLNADLPENIKDELLSIQNNDDELKGRFGMDLLRFTIGLIQKSEYLLANDIFRHHIYSQIKHHTDTCHR